MLTRRGLFRLVGGAIAAAVAVPTVPTVSIWKTRALGSSVLTYEMLEQAYQSCVVGREVPQMMIVGSQRQLEYLSKAGVR